jgi:hypothetical protein
LIFALVVLALVFYGYLCITSQYDSLVFSTVVLTEYCELITGLVFADMTDGDNWTYQENTLPRYVAVILRNDEVDVRL